MIMLDDVFVPEERLLEVSGLKGPFSCLNKARYGIGWGVLGAATACFRRLRGAAIARAGSQFPLFLGIGCIGSGAFSGNEPADGTDKQSYCW
jgi:alkylation response protein AidB-like acyl-CoA dehydrogenase